MTMSEVEVDRITQQVFAARNSGLDAALVKVVIDEIEKATEAQAAKIARVEKLAERWEATAARAMSSANARKGLSDEQALRQFATTTKVRAMDLLGALGGDS